jgi:tRNA A-37 threonylcarbamoyl transferase component Bud32
MPNPTAGPPADGDEPGLTAPLHEVKRDEMIGRVVGSWRVVKLLGEGGMGSVYMGEHPAIGSKVAIKMLHPRFDADERIVERFFNEAKAVNVIGHDNIVNILDFNVADGGRHYFVMEFLHGRPLQELVRPGAPLPLGRAGPILLQCCRALQAAHERGIVHRDFKPDNVFLVDRDGRTDFVKLVDFGIAKLTDPTSAHLTQTGTVIGTPAYMSPEQASGEPSIDARSDVYSLGVTMFQMFTGKVPFADAGPSFGKILTAHLYQPPPPPRTLNPEIPAQLEEIILKTLEKNPDDRYQTMSELHEALRGCMEELGISAGLPLAGEGQPSPARSTPPGTRRTDPAATPARGVTQPRTRTLAAPAARGGTESRTGTRLVPPPRPRRANTAVLAVVGAALAIAIGALAFVWFRGAEIPQPKEVRPVPPAPGPMQGGGGEPERPPSPPPPSTPPSNEERAQAPPRAPGFETPAPPAPPPRRQRTPPQERTTGKPEQQTKVAAAMPEKPAVFFQCTGAQEVCSALRTAIDDELEKARFTSVRNAARADIGISARVAGVEGRVTPQFETTFAVRTYSIALSAEATRTSEAVSMPPPTTVSYDPSFGSERVAEKARVVAGEVADKLQGFLSKHR